MKKGYFSNPNWPLLNDLVSLYCKITTSTRYIPCYLSTRQMCCHANKMGEGGFAALASISLFDAIRRNPTKLQTKLKLLTSSQIIFLLSHNVLSSFFDSLRLFSSIVLQSSKSISKSIDSPRYHQMGWWLEISIAIHVPATLSPDTPNNHWTQGWLEMDQLSVPHKRLQRVRGMWPRTPEKHNCDQLKVGAFGIESSVWT